MLMIYVDYEGTLKKAKKLEEVADRLEKIATGNGKMDGLLQKVAGEWRGDYSGVYLSKGRAVRSDIAETARHIRTIAKGLRDTVASMKAAEQKSIDIIYGKR